MSNPNNPNQKFRPVFTASGLEALVALIESAPYEMKLVPENKKLISYIKTFSFKVQHEMVSPSAILKGENMQELQPAKKSRLDMTQAELDAEAVALADELDMYSNMKF